MSCPPVLLLIVLAAAGCANRLLLYPSTDPILIANSGLERRVIGEQGLEVWIARTQPQQSPAAFVLTFNGNADRAERAALAEAERFAEHAVEIWAVNYPGYGGSAGPARLAAIPNAALTAYDALTQVAGGRPIVAVGISIGATVALYVARERKVHAMVLVNPPPLRRLILRRHGWWNLWLVAVPVALQVPSELDAPSSAEKVRVPAVFVLAEQDDIVPSAYQRVVVDAYAGPKQVIATSGGHNDGETESELTAIRAAIAWALEP